jgi:hypothetical protein
MSTPVLSQESPSPAIYTESLMRELSKLDSVDAEFEVNTVTEIADLENAFGLAQSGPDSFHLCHLCLSCSCCFAGGIG